MSGFWTKTPNNLTVHIKGDPNMSDETLGSLGRIMDLAYEQACREQIKTVSTTAKIPIPAHIAICPACDAPLIARTEAWNQLDDETWIAEEVYLSCAWEESLSQSGELPEFELTHKQASDMPYVHWLPVSEKVKAFVNENYRFNMDDTPF